MIQIKKTILTLVALLAVTTGAWAQGPWTSGDCTVTLNGGSAFANVTEYIVDYPQLIPENYDPEEQLHFNLWLWKEFELT